MELTFLKDNLVRISSFGELADGGLTFKVAWKDGSFEIETFSEDIIVGNLEPDVYKVDVYSGDFRIDGGHFFVLPVLIECPRNEHLLFSLFSGKLSYEATLDAFSLLQTAKV